MFDNLKLLRRLDLKEYWQDLFGLGVTWILVYGTIFYLFRFVPWDPFHLLKQADLLVPTQGLLIIVWLIIYLLFWSRFWNLAIWILRKLIHDVLFENRFTLDTSRFKEEWEFQGNLDVNPIEREIQITNTPSGCLVKNDFWDSKVWKNFSATFKIDFRKIVWLEDDWFNVNKDNEALKELKKKESPFRSVIAVVFRAQSLDDYFMLSFWKIGNVIVFRPHVQISGNLDIPIRNPKTNQYPLKSGSSELCFKILTENKEVNVFLLYRKKWVKCYKWLLPDFYRTNLNQVIKDNGTSKHITRKVPFSNSFGQLGFRNYGEELAYVKSLSINGKFSKDEKDLLTCS